MSEKIDEIRRKMNAEKLTPEYKSFMERIERVLPKATIMKDNMKKKGLTRARAKCPFCAGEWHAILAGRKQHFHMRCDGDRGSIMME